MTRFSDNFWKKFFVLASLWNISAIPLLILLYVYFPTFIFTNKAIPFIYNPIFGSFYFIFANAVLLFGIGYYMPSRDLMLNRAVIWLGSIGKIALTLIFLQLYTTGYITVVFPVLLIGDLIWAAWFFVFLYQTKGRVKIHYLVG